MEFFLSGASDIKDASRLIQRHLYRIAKENGWRRKRNGGWIHPEKQSDQMEMINYGN